MEIQFKHFKFGYISNEWKMNSRDFTSSHAASLGSRDAVKSSHKTCSNRQQTSKSNTSRKHTLHALRRKGETLTKCTQFVINLNDKKNEKTIQVHTHREQTQKPPNAPRRRTWAGGAQGRCVCQ
jgi:hypothetical protein